MDSNLRKDTLRPVVLEPPFAWFGRKLQARLSKIKKILHMVTMVSHRVGPGLVCYFT